MNTKMLSLTMILALALGLLAWLAPADAGEAGLRGLAGQLNHAEVLWDRSLQLQVAQIIAPQHRPLPLPAKEKTP